MEKQSHEFEFFGPTVGPVAIILGLPIVCYGLIFLSNANGCLNLQNLIIPQIPNNLEFFNHNAVGVVIGWFVYLIVLHLVLPGKVVQGVKLKNGDQLKYKLNGLLLMMITLIALGIFGFYIPIIDLSWLYYNFTAALTASLIISFSLSIYLYASSFVGTKLLSGHGSSGYIIYDFFMGRELNPRIGNLDLKEFCELYPGLIGWVILNLGMLAKQYNDLERVTNSMILINVFQLIYVLDALWFEQSILTTMDITTDGFGFMLAFGDLTWVPFTYCLQARFLADNPQDLSFGYTSLVLGLFFLGYGTFRGSNGQKDTFRRNPSHPSVKNLRTLKTERGRMLLIDGWWKIARHINYTGDWLLGLSWCMTCGFSCAIPYFYAVYFAVLLIHRDLRDGLSCQQKYGADWTKYCQIVKYRLIPFVY